MAAMPDVGMDFVRFLWGLLTYAGRYGFGQVIMRC